MAVQREIAIDAEWRFCRNCGMIRTRIAVVIVALSVIATGACFAANPHMGTWKLNEAKSELAPGLGKNNTVVYTEEKDKMKVTVDGVDKDGKPTHGVWVGQADGKTYKMKGNLAWDAAAYKVVNDHTYEITTMKGGKVHTNGKSTVSADGKTRTVSTIGTDEKGNKFSNKGVFDKQ
jgi:lipopolysaccharide export LptBFGC system permease protein LptF